MRRAFYFLSFCPLATVNTQSIFQKLFLADNTNIPRAEFKRLMLTGFLAVICIGVAIIYSLFDISSGVYHGLAGYAVLFFSSLLSIYCMRRGEFTFGKLLLMVSANFVVFWSALIDPFETGVFLFFIPTGIGAFVMLGENRIIASSLVALTTALFLIAYFLDIENFKMPNPTALYVQLSFLFNYAISLSISVLAVNFLINLNRLSENELIQKEIFASEKNAELQKVNIELDRFVYSVSHDLRSPLSSILGLINLTRQTEDIKEIRELLMMIQGRVHAQDHFIKEIIDYARNARTDNAAEPIVLKNLVREVISSLSFTPNAEKINFRVHIDSETIVISDHIRLTVILSNIIGNAIKYHDFHKENPYVEVGFREAENLLYVSDNGAGMQPEHMGKIFNMFYRGSENSQGSGLGLFITKETVTKLGGEIKATSSYGEGSTFNIFLPFAKVAPPQLMKVSAN